MNLSKLPLAHYVVLINTIAGVLTALVAGIAAMTQALPPADTHLAAVLGSAGLGASALSGGLFAIGKGIHNVGDNLSQTTNAPSA